MLFQELGKLKRSMIMTSVIMMAAGILMLICPERYGRMLVAAAGYGLLILSGSSVLPERCPQGAGASVRDLSGAGRSQ